MIVESNIGQKQQLLKIGLKAIVLHKIDFASAVNLETFIWLQGVRSEQGCINNLQVFQPFLRFLTLDRDLLTFVRSKLTIWTWSAICHLASGRVGCHKEVAGSGKWFFEQLNVSIKALDWFDYFCCQILKVLSGLDFFYLMNKIGDSSI